MAGQEPNYKNKLFIRRMSICLVMVGVCMVAGHSTMSDYVSSAFVSGHIYIPNAVYKIPSQQSIGTVSHTFRIYNLRPKFLQVEAQPNCGCTGVSWDKATIKPFGWKDIAAIINKKSNGDSVTIAFHTDSRDKPWLFAFINT